MSQENVERMRLALEAFNRRDFETMAGLVTDDFEFAPYLASTLETTTYRGPDWFQRYDRDRATAWESLQVRAEEIRDLGDRLLMFGEIRGRGRTSTIETQAPIAWVADFQEGQLKRVQSYGKLEEALEAVGLREEDLKPAD